ncbi:MAG: tRNA 2-thiouridine(34) synthase MnmA [Nitrospirota bacterium]
MMNRGKKVVVGLSGGVDSAVVASMLVALGYRVEGVTLRTWSEPGEREKRWQDRSCCKIGIAEYVAKELGIPHRVIDARERFRRAVIDDFCATYAAGRTPNPCVLCNERVKFALLSEAAEEMGADLLATGHYARVEHDARSGRHRLLKGVDPLKDQSYFLYRLSQNQLRRTLFPLGGLTKAEVWQRAEAMGLPVDDIAESQEICFVTQKDYREFVAAQLPETEQPGAMVGVGGEALGSHRGVAFYTVGQRRGLGVAAGERRYVTELDAERNLVVLGGEADLYTNACEVEDVRLGAVAAITEPTRVSAKYRYKTPEACATLSPYRDGLLRVVFDQTQRAVAPGQSIVFYDGNVVVGGGVIASTA